MSNRSLDGLRRFPRSASARTFAETYYNERHTPLEYPRVDPYSYPMGGPVSGLRTRSHVDRDEFQPDQGGSRRRTAVACARCRKRKIRCSGDSGDGQGCHNCKIAGVEASQCQFHRVGSDHVHKVMDSYNMVQSLTNLASAHSMTPMYPTDGSGQYHRGMPNLPYQQVETKFAYPQLDAKSAYGSGWTTPYEDDTSPIDNYSYDQSPTYLPPVPTPNGLNLCGLSCCWTPQNARTGGSTSGYYSDYGHSYISNGVPYLQNEISPVVSTKPISPLNMSSLQLTLPERPRQRQTQPTEVPLTPQRRLPAPQPKPGHGLHHALDHQQDQRLRSSQTIGTPLSSNVTPSSTKAGFFTKPKSLLPWAIANKKLMKAVNETKSSDMPPPPILTQAQATATDELSGSLSIGTSGTDTSTITGTSSSNELSFNTLSLLDPLIMTTPTPPAYSNFRDSRNLSASALTTQLPRNNSSSSLYTYDNISRRPSFPGNDSSTKLVSGHQYAPLSQPAETSHLEDLTKESLGHKTSHCFVTQLPVSAATSDGAFK